MDGPLYLNLNVRNIVQLRIAFAIKTPHLLVMFNHKATRSFLDMHHIFNAVFRQTPSALIKLIRFRVHPFVLHNQRYMRIRSWRIYRYTTGTLDIQKRNKFLSFQNGRQGGGGYREDTPPLCRGLSRSSIHCRTSFHLIPLELFPLISFSLSLFSLLLCKHYRHPWHPPSLHSFCVCVQF